MLAGEEDIAAKHWRCEREGQLRGIETDMCSVGPLKVLLFHNRQLKGRRCGRSSQQGAGDANPVSDAGLCCAVCSLKGGALGGRLRLEAQHISCR